MMGFLDAAHLGIVTAIQPSNLFFCLVGVTIGTLIGVLPGIGTSGTVAILLPITFNLSPVAAIIMLAGIYYGAMYGGSITSILVNIPGEAASVVTCIDGYAMARKGRAGAALGIAAFGSFIAGYFGICLLALMAPTLSRLAFDFGPPEFFSLMVLGLTLSTYIGSGSVLKSLMMVALGLALGVVGQDPITATPRLTYGSANLLDGLDMVPVVMGLFGLSEVMINIEQATDRVIYQAKLKGLLPDADDWKRALLPIGRGSVLGFFIGIIPGGTAMVSSFVAYAVEKKFSNHPEEFGTGAIEGVAGPEAANNSATMGAMVPLLTLGIPSNVVMALFLAALMIHGTPPGPMLLVNHPGLFWGVIFSMLIGNILLLILNLPLIPLWVKLLEVPYKVLFPLIILFCLIGAFSVNSTTFGMGVMILFGVVGYLMKKYEYEAGPLVLAFILGPLLETALRQSLIVAQGNFSIFIQKPISMVSLVITV
ncbi:MAG: tripartite tricarboxylate transporter permease, partial [Deltaproteobacteria bacterium]|nr:tripartite tricarboxylate transporter permease [Deltaproteobacteria bacterium]